MKTKWMLMVGALSLAVDGAMAQAWDQGGNNIIGATDHLGCDAASTQPLRFTTFANLSHEWRTNNIWRMRLMGDNFAGNINGYPGLNLSGFLGLGQFANALVPQPFAMLHLDAGGTQDSGFRPWMQTGMLLTRQSDQAYFGLKDELLARNHTVIAWSDNDILDPGPDRLKFIFVANNVLASGIAGTLDGLEAGRFTPAGTGNEAFFGLGDWFTAGLDPTERLDLLNGRARIRQLPTDPVSASTEIVTVDMTAGANFGVLEHRPLLPLLGTCEWTMNAVAPNHVYTAVGPVDPNCPDDAENVGIGTATPFAKLDIARTVNSGGVTSLGFNLNMSTNSTNNHGGFSDVQVTAAGMNLGWRAYVCRGGQSWGMDGVAALSNTGNTVNWTGARIVGVRGFADGNNTPIQASQVRGVWGIATGIGPSGGAGFAGWFDGLTHCTNFAWQSSDAQFKENVVTMDDALTTIMALQPKSYTLKASDYPTMVFDTGLQYGFIAQDVEAVLPDIVRDLEQPDQVDSLGNVVAPGFEFKAMQYDALIPWLVAGMQEQQGIIQQLEAQMAQMDQQLASCCTDDGTRMQQGATIGYIDNALQPAAQANTALTKNDLVVIPNPFQENPTISYRIGTTGRAQLRVSSGDGRDMGLLFDAGMQAGQHTLVWNTTGMTVGTYWLTLTLDGVRITEQAVKVQ